MRTEIVRIQRELAVTTLYVTHDQVEAMTMADRVAVMRGGVLQQFDTPDRVYSEPANLFVAGFIGSPAMNLVEGRFERQEGGDVRCRIGAQVLPLPDGLLDARPGLAGAVGRTVAIGVRPEALSLASASEQPTISGSVVIAESLGFETLAHVAVAATPITSPDVLESAPDAAAAGLHGSERTTTVVARLPAGTALQEGRPVELAVDLTKLQVFDLESGQALR
jgi:multiple sugar transport system ATP-binding protein